MYYTAIIIIYNFFWWSLPITTPTMTAPAVIKNASKAYITHHRGFCVNAFTNNECLSRLKVIMAKKASTIVEKIDAIINNILFMVLF